MSHFPPGIFWDPREPLPPEMQQYIPGGRMPAYEDRLLVNFAVATGHLPHEKASLPGHIDNFRATGPANAPVPKEKKQKLFPDTAVVVPGQGNEPALCVLVPLSVAIKARVVLDVAKITVTQLYFNDSERAIEQSGYTFPLPSGCTVTAFSCRVGKNKTMRGHIKPKQEAKEAFSDAVNQRLSAALLEEATSEIFTVSLGNISPSTKVKVELSFAMRLKHRFAGVDGISRSTTTLTIPTSIAPRYGDAPPSSRLDLASTDISRGLSLEVQIDSCDKANKVSSLSHDITVETCATRSDVRTWRELTGAGLVEKEAEVVNADLVLVKLSLERAELGRDFVLDIQTELGEEEDEEPRAVLEIHPTIENQAALMLKIPPKVLLSSAGDANNGIHDAGEVVFLADRSGSMSDKIDSLKSAMQFFLKGIPIRRKFNVWCFGSSFMNLWPKSVEYTEDSLQVALAFVENSFAADMGGTELLPAIQAIVAARDRSMSVDIIVLTDGEVWRQDETIEFIRNARHLSEGRVRLFALGVGDAVSHFLVEGMAAAGGGYSEVVPAHTRDGWEDRVVAMTRAALTNHIGSLEIGFELHSGREVEVGEFAVPDPDHGLPRMMQSPPNLSTLNLYQAGRIFVLFNKMATPIKLRHVVLRTVHRLGGVASRTLVPLSVAGTKDDTIHALAAEAVLADMRLDPAPKDTIGGEAPHKQARPLGEVLACRFSIASQWTSFFVAEERAAPPGEANDSASETVPVAMVAKTLSLMQKRTAITAVNGSVHGASRRLPRLFSSKPKGQLDAIRLLPSFRNPRGHQGHHAINSVFSPIDDHASKEWEEGASNSSARDGEKQFVRDCLGTRRLTAPSFPESGTKRAATPDYFLTAPMGLKSSGRTIPKEGASNSSETDGEKEFVRDLLRHQAFDGAFSFPGGWDELDVALGARCCAAIVALRQACSLEEQGVAAATILGIPVRAAHTLMVIGILETHFKHSEGLWQLMVMKAWAFVEKEVPDKEERQRFVDSWTGLYLIDGWESGQPQSFNDEAPGELELATRTAHLGTNQPGQAIGACWAAEEQRCGRDAPQDLTEPAGDRADVKAKGREAAMEPSTRPQLEQTMVTPSGGRGKRVELHTAPLEDSDRATMWHSGLQGPAVKRNRY